MNEIKDWVTINDILFNDLGRYKKMYNFSYDSYKKDGELFLELMLPGFEKENIKIDYADKKLSVKIERNQKEDYDYIQKNSFFGKTVETFSLPFEPETIDATYENGVLRMKIKRKESNLPVIKFK